MLVLGTFVGLTVKDLDELLVESSIFNEWSTCVDKISSSSTCKIKLDSESEGKAI